MAIASHSRRRKVQGRRAHLRENAGISPKKHLQNPTLPARVECRARKPQRPSQDSPLSCGLLLTILGTGEPRVPRRARPRTRCNGSETASWKTPWTGEERRAPGGARFDQRGPVPEIPARVDEGRRHAPAAGPPAPRTAAPSRRWLHARQDGAGRRPLNPGFHNDNGWATQDAAADRVAMHGAALPSASSAAPVDFRRAPF